MRGNIFRFRTGKCAVFRSTMSMLSLLMLIFGAQLQSGNLFAQEKMEDSKIENLEKEAVKKVVEYAYIQGIHGNQDEKVVRSGFHPEFNMLVQQNDAIKKVTVDEWLENLKIMIAENPDLWKSKTTHQFEVIDVTGNAAMVKIQVYKGSKHFSTDYMLLYKFDEGWKIVSKIFNLHI